MAITVYTLSGKVLTNSANDKWLQKKEEVGPGTYRLKVLDTGSHQASNYIAWNKLKINDAYPTVNSTLPTLTGGSNARGNDNLNNLIDNSNSTAWFMNVDNNDYIEFQADSVSTVWVIDGGAMTQPLYDSDFTVNIYKVINGVETLIGTYADTARSGKYHSGGITVECTDV